MILVTGGTGTLGRLVVERLREAGQEVRILSRRAHFIGDLATGEGLDAAVDGVSTIVHCASNNKGDAEATRNLVRAASTSSTHLVYISVVGADRLTFGYLRSKLDSEKIIEESGLPYTILRATQFYDLILSGARKLGALPVIPVPASFPVQPIDPDEVAARLLELALGAPAGRVPDLGGPHVASFAELIRGYLQARNRRRWIVPIRLPATKTIRAGGLLPQAGHTGRRTWAEFLAERV